MHLVAEGEQRGPVGSVDGVDPVTEGLPERVEGVVAQGSGNVDQQQIGDAFAGPGEGFDGGDGSALGAEGGAELVGGEREVGQRLFAGVLDGEVGGERWWFAAGGLDAQEYRVGGLGAADEEQAGKQQGPGDGETSHRVFTSSGRCHRRARRRAIQFGRA